MLTGPARVVTIAHRLSTVMDANQVIVLEAGRVRATGTHDTLLETDELYGDLVGALRIATGDGQPLVIPHCPNRTNRTGRNSGGHVIAG